MARGPLLSTYRPEIFFSTYRPEIFWFSEKVGRDWCGGIVRIGVEAMTAAERMRRMRARRREGS